MPDRTSTRSAGYQHVIVECPHSPDMLAECSDAQGIAGVLNSKIHNEELMDLQDQLLTEFWRIVEMLTPRQQEVLKLYAQGLTQIEIAKKLNVNQSSVTKSLNGNTDYRNGRKVYGGARKKLRRIVDKDEKIQNILRRIADIKSELY